MKKLSRSRGLVCSLAAFGAVGLAVSLCMRLPDQAVAADSDALGESSFAVLYPVDAKELALARTKDEAIAVVARTAPSLSDFMSREALAVLIEKSIAAPDARSPFGANGGASDTGVASNDLAKTTRAVDIGSWFVVGVRLSPCVNTSLVPTSWLGASSAPGAGAFGADFSSPEAAALRMLCVPQVRLVAQPFGARREADAATGVFIPQGASDDKSMHIVFDYLPGFSPALDAAFADASGAFDARIRAAANAGTLTPSNVRAGAGSDFDDAALESGLAGARAQLVRVAAQLQKAQGTAPLALDAAVALGTANASARGGALQEFTRALKADVWPALRLRHVTLNLSNSGALARPGNAWSFTKFEGSRDRSMLTSHDESLLQKVFVRMPLESLAWSQSSAGIVARSVSAGASEVFLPVPGSATSIDDDLLTAAASDPIVAGALPFSGFLPFVREENGALVPNDSLQRDLAEGVRGPSSDTLAIVLGGVFAPEVHSAQSTSCASCHASTGARDLYLKDTYPTFAAPSLRDNTTQVSFGHSRFNPMWNLRMFGYFERAPAVADRVVLEARTDLGFARALLAKGLVP